MHASSWCLDALKWLLSYQPINNKELSMQFVLTFVNFTGARAATIRCLDSIEVKKLPHDEDLPRRFYFNPDKIKNDAGRVLSPDKRCNLHLILFPLNICHS